MFEHEADRLFLFRDKWASEYAVSCLHWTFITRAGCIMTPTLSWMITDSRYLVVWCNLTDNAMWRRQQWTAALTALWPVDTRDLRSHRVWVSPEPAISCQQPSHVDTRRVSISSRCWLLTTPGHCPNPWDRDHPHSLDTWHIPRNSSHPNQKLNYRLLLKNFYRVHD